LTRIHTKDNLDFAFIVDLDNDALRRLETIINKNKITTGLSTIGDEKKWNLFMRLQAVVSVTEKMSAFMVETNSLAVRRRLTGLERLRAIEQNLVSMFSI
jgi:hypothetical protein